MYSLKRLPLSICRKVKNHFKRTLTSTVAPVVQNTETNKDADVIVDRLGEITTIGINCPEKKNSLDRYTARNLADAIDQFEKDDEALVAVLHGTGGNFCAGYDLKEISQYDGESEENVPHFGPLVNRMQLTGKPMIAALSGYCVGAGLELALLCDQRVMEETAILGMFNRRFGIPTLGGGTVRLQSMIGYSRAMDMILTGRGVNAEEAFAWGLANRLVACGTGLGQALNLAQCLLKFPQRSLLADRASVHYAAFSAKSFEDALQNEKDSASHLLLEEGVDGAKKFAAGLGKHGKFYNLRPKNLFAFKELSEDLL